uniref:Uncharacterized protein n=1 Tax=Corethron hystrix TaxID=216773 RepID=A0A7S1G219_9STRA|mmetsp:Transcript_7960/g.17275  ORF Transcript_7960/g.17275 Transcript_7960/m.17275 type:complete len:159 (+) Transcript_7960:157-633(+)
MSSTLQPRGRLEKNLSREQSDDESTTFISLSVIDGSSNDITNSPKRETNLLLDGTESYETSDTSEYEKNVNFQASEYDIDEEELCFLYSASRSLSEKNLESPPSYPTVDGYKLRKKRSSQGSTFHLTMQKDLSRIVKRPRIFIPELTACIGLQIPELS